MFVTLEYLFMHETPKQVFLRTGTAGGAVSKEHRGRAKRAEAGDHQNKNHLMPYCVWVTEFVLGFLLISLKWDHMACGFEDLPSSE